MSTGELIQRNHEAIARADELLPRPNQATRRQLLLKLLTHFAAHRNGVPAPGLAELQPMGLPHLRTLGTLRPSSSILARVFGRKENCKAHRLAKWLAISPQFTLPSTRLD